jgi:hypothetical protein
MTPKTPISLTTSAESSFPSLPRCNVASTIGMEVKMIGWRRGGPWFAARAFPFLLGVRLVFGGALVVVLRCQLAIHMQDGGTTNCPTAATLREQIPKIRSWAAPNYSSYDTVVYKVVEIGQCLLMAYTKCTQYLILLSQRHIFKPSFDSKWPLFIGEMLWLSVLA